MGGRCPSVATLTRTQRSASSPAPAANAPPDGTCRRVGVRLVEPARRSRGSSERKRAPRVVHVRAREDVRCSKTVLRRASIRAARRAARRVREREHEGARGMGWDRGRGPTNGSKSRPRPVRSGSRDRSARDRGVNIHSARDNASITLLTRDCGRSKTVSRRVYQQVIAPLCEVMSFRFLETCGPDRTDRVKYPARTGLTTRPRDIDLHTVADASRRRYCE